MTNRFFGLYAFFLIVRPLLATAGDGASLQTGYGQMYNLQFSQAHQTFKAYERECPDDPMGTVSDAAAYLFSEFNRLGVLESQFLTNDNEVLDSRRLKEDPEATRGFEKALSRTDTLVNKALQKNSDDPNALIAKTIRLGLHSDYLALIQKRDFAALKEIKEGRETAQALLARHPDYQDANIAMGVENYLLSLKAAPLRWILRATGSQNRS